MLSGQYQHNMDLKGRVTFPSKFREDLGDTFYVCKGLDHCLFVLSNEQWEALETKLSGMPLSKGKDIQRFFFSSVEKVEPDKQGRILIPQHLREYAGLEKEVTVIGAAVRAEIWNSATWKKYEEAQSEDSIVEVMELLDF